MKTFKYIFAGATACLLMAACSEDKYIVNSDPNLFSIEPVALVVDANGGEYTLNIMGHENWKAELKESNSSAQDWVTLSAYEGQGAQEITLNVTQSGSFTNRRTIVIEVTNEAGKVLRSRVLQGTQVLGENEVLINGNVWSTVNVDLPGTFCKSPDEIGHVYQFNRKTPYTFENQENYSYTPDPEPVNWQAENDPCPEGWRVPKAWEMAALWEIGATWVKPAQTGFSVGGIIVGIPEADAKMATKENLKSLGGLFLPKSGWIAGDGKLDRTWLVAVRTASSLSDTHGGMSLGDSGGYRDTYGWGDGQKERAAMIRPIKVLAVED